MEEVKAEKIDLTPIRFNARILKVTPPPSSREAFEAYRVGAPDADLPATADTLRNENSICLIYDGEQNSRGTPI